MTTLSYPLRLFFFNDPAATEIYTLSLHDALPICDRVVAGGVVQAAARKRRADANARVAAVRDRAGVPVVANGSLELHGVRAGAGRGVARPRVVALVGGGADDGVDAGTESRMTGVGLRAGGPVVARGAI